MSRFAATLSGVMLVASVSPGAQSAEEEEMNAKSNAKARRPGLRECRQHVVNQTRNLDVRVGPGDGPCGQF